ncbi:MAG: hypothetical protein INR70_18000 [Parafilimonas terrae]|nr:hypothetical protein [Parafilimonas terrae]
MSGRPRVRLTAYLVATGGEQGANAPVYAVRTRTAAEAMAAVQASAGFTGKPVIVGSLSTRMAKAIGLKTGDVRAL